MDMKNKGTAAKRRMRAAYWKLFKLEVYMEWPSVTRGHTWLDWVYEDDCFQLWAGRFYLCCDIER